jgi:A/G-specific adenine glycosylase
MYRKKVTTESLKAWFLQNKRSFPWRDSPTPYAVWVSEVMLQQTRATVVVSYFTKWMKRFPTLSSLAKASLEDVFKVWEGLGYYSRARNLHKGAIQMEQNGGELPSTLSELLKINGIGPYTAGAILSFAFHQKAPAIDGNVERVVSRYIGIEGDLKKEPSKTRLKEETFALLPNDEPWIAMEALIELGATHCLPNPTCNQCPLSKTCFANLKGVTKLFPFKKKRQETIFLEKQVVILLDNEGNVLVQKKEEGKVLGGLAEFPSFPYLPDQDVEAEVKKLFGIESVFQEDLKQESQSFTKYKVELYPSILQVFQKMEVPGFFWHPLEDLEKDLTFSSGHKRILMNISRVMNFF